MAIIPTNQTLTTPFITRNGRLWANHDLDLSVGKVFSIDNTPILSTTTLGVTVSTSNLRQVGTLHDLEVAGNAILSNFAYFNSEFGRLGLGTNEASLALDIVENNVNIAMGSPDANLATVGTLSNHDLAIVTDSVARVTIKNTGEVTIGDPVNKSGVLNVYGTLNVTNIVADTRVEKSSSLHFYSTGNASVYGLGLIWAGAGVQPKQLMLMSGPDRIHSTESLDLAEGRSFSISGQSVLSGAALGPSVIYSNLITVGSLQNLQVSGHTVLNSDVTATQGTTQLRDVIIVDNADRIDLSATKLNAFGDFGITTQRLNIVSHVNGSIIIGDASNTRKPVRVFGPLSVNTQNPDPRMSLTVPGDVSIGGSVQTRGTAAPELGEYTAGDICWNTSPTANSYVGWVCVTGGNPGHWIGFGLIASQ